jgi:tetratricopeptide (TPR) repeat protein
MNLENALKAIQMATRQYPNEICFKLKKSRYFSLAGKPEMALKLLRQVEVIDADNPEFHMVYGQILSQQGHSMKAIEKYTKASEDEDFEEAATMHIAIEYERLGNFKSAIEWLRKALLINPDNDYALNDLDFCHEITATQEDAIKFYLEFIDNNPFNDIAWFNLGESYFSMENYEQAIEAYDYALSINRSFAPAYFNKGNAQTCLGRYDEAIESYHETFALESPDSLTYYYLGECFERKQDYSKALEYYKKSLELDTMNPDVFIGVAICLSELLHEDLALEFIERALALDGNNVDYLRMKADILQKMERYDRAFEVYKKIILLDKSDPEIWMDYADAWMETGDLENGLDVLRSGLVFHPDNAPLKYRMSACLVRAGKLQEATIMFEKALHIDPNCYSDAFEYYPPMKDIPVFLDLLDLK